MREILHYVIYRNLFEAVKINHMMALAQCTALPLNTQRLRATL
jgi:hypothetical protein